MEMGGAVELVYEHRTFDVAATGVNLGVEDESAFAIMLYTIQMCRAFGSR